jgi:subtilisin family serine protease
VIVKLRAESEPVRRAARDLLAGARVAAPQSVIARLIENGYAVSADPVLDVPMSPERVAPGARFLAAAIAPARGKSHAHGLVEVIVDPKVSAHRLAADLQARGDEIEYAHVPAIRYAFAARRRRPPARGADPMASRQWAHGAVRIAHARHLPRFNDAAEVSVAIADSGVDVTHPDLARAIAEYKNFLTTETDKDFIGHGTHVAGIIAAGLDNAIGVSGLCAARILALKVLPRRDADWSAKQYYRALRYTIGRVRVLNLSLGGDRDESELNVLRDVISAGVVVVAAMGNEFEEGNPIEYPAAMAEVCAVGATDQLDRRAEFSNTGPHVDLVAPGVEILSTTPTYRYADGRRRYDSWDGTSMAAPHVAAAAALLAARHPAWTPAKIVSRLKQSADKVPGQRSRRDGEFGAGRLNIEAALR